MYVDGEREESTKKNKRGGGQTNFATETLWIAAVRVSLRSNGAPLSKLGMGMVGKAARTKPRALTRSRTARRRPVGDCMLMPS